MKTYKLFWAPEGKYLDTVQANTIIAAKRKAPMPYRKYLGEIYTIEVISDTQRALLEVL